VFCLYFIDVLLGNTNESTDPVSLEDPDDQIITPKTLQPLPGPATRSAKENSNPASFQVSDVPIGTLTTSGKENPDELSMNLDPVNATELVSTPKAQKPTKEEKQCKTLEREAKKAEDEKQRKSKASTKKQSVKSSACNSKRQKIVGDDTDDECKESGLQYREI